VRRVLEVVVALADAGRAAEVVDRDGRVAALREPQRELLVEAVEPADVREDDDARMRLAVGRRHERGELVPVGGAQDDVVVRDGRAGDDRDGRRRVGVEAHATSLNGRGSRAKRGAAQPTRATISSTSSSW
jgi:hypothetical protein